MAFEVWMKQAVLSGYLHLVADVLAQSKFEYLQGIVVLDCCAPAHVGEHVFQVAKDRDLYLCYVPAGCTPYVQLLDVGCFSTFAQGCTFTKGHWLLAVDRVVRKFLPGRVRKHVFARCGLVGGRLELRGILGRVVAKYDELKPVLRAPTSHVLAKVKLLPSHAD